MRRLDKSSEVCHVESECAEQVASVDGAAESEVVETRATELSIKLSHLKSTVLETVRSREVLPQPLFWSLFHAQLADVRRQKAHARLMRKLTLGIEL